MMLFRSELTRFSFLSVKTENKSKKLGGLVFFFTKNKFIRVTRKNRRPEKDENVEKGCQKSASQQKTTDDDNDEAFADCTA